MSKNNKGGTNMTKRNKISDKKELSQEQSEELLRVLKVRFEKNMNRHKGLDNFYNNFIICVQPAQSNRALTAVNAG